MAERPRLNVQVTLRGSESGVEGKSSIHHILGGPVMPKYIDADFNNHTKDLQ